MKTPEEGYALGWADAIYAYESKQKKQMSTVDDLMAMADDYARAVADSPHMPTPLERARAGVRIEASRDALRAALEETLAEVARLRAERDGLLVDAKRYRWLRDSCNAIDNPEWVWIFDAESGWDATIDEAMTASIIGKPPT